MAVMLDLEALAPPITRFSLDRMKYLISTIVTHRQDDHPGAYSVLNAQFLRNIVPHAEKYLAFLRDMGVIEWKNYSAGRNSRLYRITRAYDSGIIYRAITDAYLINRIKKNANRLKLQNSRQYPTLNRFVHAVQIDVPAALETIEKAYQKNPDKIKAEARRTFSIAEVLKIDAGQIYIRVNGTNNRYDSNYTRLPGELVPHLTINGKALTELDIRNSQPFFAIGLFDPSPEIQQIIGNSFTMLAKRLQLLDKMDVKMYTLLVTKGKFYDFMEEKFQEYGISFTDRDDFKEQLFTVFFGKNSALHYSPAVKLFEMLFPNVYELFSKIKEQDHARLPILLQRIEAFIMLDCVTPRIISEFPNVAFITKHDSLLPAGVMVTGKVDEILNLMKSEIKKIVRFSPEIKVKNDPDLFISDILSSSDMLSHYVGQKLVTN